MQIQTFNDLLTLQLQTLYSVEQQLVQHIPLVAEIASDKQLKTALTEHLDITKHQQERLEQIGEDAGLILTGVPDQAMMYLLKSSQSVVQEITDPKLKDAAIMGGSEKIEHYEVAAYESAIVIAKKLGKKKIVDNLTKTLHEEAQAAQTIIDLAQQA